MKMKECREKIGSDVAKIRRSGDLGTVYKVSELFMRLQTGQWTDRDLDVLTILNSVFSDNVPDRTVSEIRVFVSSYIRASEKRRSQA